MKFLPAITLPSLCAGIVKSAKATLVATKLMEKCSFHIATKYKFSPRMIQTGARKLCVVFRFCFHKYQSILNTSGYNAYSEAVYPCVAKLAPLLTVKLNPDYVDANITSPGGLFIDGVVLFKTGYHAYSEAVYPCVDKMARLLTVKLNPEYNDVNITDAEGLFSDGVACAAKHEIFTDDIAVALAGIKWVRDMLF
ncbi:hypothetical protein MTO96_026883 [Rhipicephalus appendiculatus]